MAITLQSIKPELQDRNGEEVTVTHVVTEADEYFGEDELPLYMVEFSDGTDATVDEDDLTGIDELDEEV